MQYITVYTKRISMYYTDHSGLLCLVLYGLAFLSANVWLLFALIYDFHKALPLLVLLVIGWIALLYQVMKKYFLKSGLNATVSITFKSIITQKLRRYIPTAIGLGLLIYIVYLATESSNQLMSLASLIIMVLLSVICSTHPARVNILHSHLYCVFRWHQQDMT